MSAFVVTNRTIAVIVCGFTLRDTYRQNELILNSALAAAQIREPDSDVALRKLGQAMFNMNVAAVDYRYRERNATELFRMRREIPPNDCVLVKALDCFLYQCSEGDVPEMPLFKALDDGRNIISRRIVGTLPAYDAAPWCLPEVAV